MTIEIRIPEVGESIEEVTLEQWLKKEGDTVAEDEPIAILESDKVTIELPAPESGTLGSIDRQAGEQCGIGDVIGHLEPASDSPDTGEQTDEKSGDAEAEEPSGPKSADREPENRSPGEDRRSGSDKPQKSDKAQKKEKPPAKETRQTGEKRQEREKRQTGEKRRREDRATEDEHRGGQGASDGGESREPAGPERREEVVPMSPVRLRIAERLLEAQRSAPILTTFNKADMSRVLELRKRYQDGFRKRHDVKLGIMSFFVKATVAALRRIPELNAEVRDQNIVYRNYCDIGIAIASDRGLVVPVLRNAERMRMAEIERAIRDFAERAEEKRLEIRELQGGTFTISNGGVFGSTFSTPIVNPPQSGILGLHAIEEQPVAREGEVVVRPVMYLALSYDHRIVDGREAVTFLKLIKDAIEEPASLILES